MVEMTTKGSRNRRRILVIVAAGFASVIAALSISTYIHNLGDNEAPSSDIAAETATLVQLTPALRKALSEFSPFDTAAGDMVLGVVPIADMDKAERTKLRNMWERTVAPNFRPKGEAGIEWRKIRWSLVRWQVPEGRHKDPSPPGPLDGYTARWAIDGLPFIVGGSWHPNTSGWGSVTISLTGDDRLYFTYPSSRELEERYPHRTVVKDIDRTRLLEILTTVFRFPWRSVDDFVVTCSLSPTSAGHLRIESLRYHQQGESRDWFDMVSLHVDPGDPQKISISITGRQ